MLGADTAISDQFSHARAGSPRDRQKDKRDKFERFFSLDETVVGRLKKEGKRQ